VDIRQIALVAVLSLPACVADPDPDAAQALDGGAMSTAVTIVDGGTSPEMQAYAQLYKMVRAGCEQPGATATKQDAHCHKTIPAWGLVVGFGAGIVF
jgi:hypothetical protein